MNNKGVPQSQNDGKPLASAPSAPSTNNGMPPMQQQLQQQQQQHSSQDDLTRARALLLSHLGQGQGPPHQQQQQQQQLLSAPAPSSNDPQQSQISQLQALEALISSQQQQQQQNGSSGNASTGGAGFGGALSALFGGAPSASHPPYQPFQQQQQQQYQHSVLQQAPAVAALPHQVSNALLQSLMGHSAGGAALTTSSNSSSGSNFVNSTAAVQMGNLTGTAAASTAQPQTDNTSHLLQSALQSVFGGNTGNGNMNQQTQQHQSSFNSITQGGQSGADGGDFLQNALAALLQTQQTQPAPAAAQQSQLPSLSSQGMQQAQSQALLQAQLQLQLMQLIANTSGAQTRPQDSGQIASSAGVNLLDFANTAATMNNQNGVSSQHPSEVALPSSSTSAAVAAVAAGKNKAIFDQETQDLLAHIPPMPAELQEMKKRKPRGRSSTFPKKLFQMLTEMEQQPGGTDIASFLPHGKSFRIHKPKEFTSDIMPKYFQMGSFSSFQRQLNLYDFQRICEGPERDAYYHELFVKDNPVLCTRIKRNKVKGLTRAKQEERLLSYEKGKERNR